MREDSQEEEKEMTYRPSSMVMRSIGTLGSEAFYDAVEELDPTIETTGQFHSLMKGNNNPYASEVYQLEMSVMMNSAKQKTAVMFTF